MACSSGLGADCMMSALETSWHSGASNSELLFTLVRKPESWHLCETERLSRPRDLKASKLLFI